MSSVEELATAPSLSIQKFCELEDISRTSFWKMEKDGKAPRIMRHGRRKVISPRARFDWHKEREDESAALAAAAQAAAA